MIGCTRCLKQANTDPNEVGLGKIPACQLPVGGLYALADLLYFPNLLIFRHKSASYIIRRCSSKPPARQKSLFRQNIT